MVVLRTHRLRPWTAAPSVAARRRPGGTPLVRSCHRYGVELDAFRLMAPVVVD